MAWYNNRYVCPECGAVWDSDWSARCNDECPDCECRDITPVSSDDLSVVVEPAGQGIWSVWSSPPDADDKPQYQLVGVLKPSEANDLLFLPARKADENGL